MRYRKERDSIGTKNVPADAFYGIFTQRALENFQISGMKAKKELIYPYVYVKKATALANMKLKVLDRKIGNAIVAGCNEILKGGYMDQFPLDVFQAGAGTPYNMNANEVIANLAVKKLRGRLGNYALVNPNNHVNMAQSSNSVTPTAGRLATLMLLKKLYPQLSKLIASFRKKAGNYKNTVKIGRTHLMDAVPITYGHVFNSYANSLQKCLGRIKASESELLEIPIGGTAVGTGLNAHPKFANLAAKELSKITGFRFQNAKDSVELTWSMAAFLRASSALRILAVELNKIANDIRLLASGPYTGIGEIVLEEVEPGSSIMPGKANPSIAECVNMVCYKVLGNDKTVEEACNNAQLELNVMTPAIITNLLWSIELLANACRMFREKCIDSLKVDEKRCRDLLEKSLSLATVLNPYIGYAKGAELVKKALKQNKPLRQVVLEADIMPRNKLDKLLNPKNMARPAAYRK